MDRLIGEIYKQDLTGTDVDYLTKNKAVLVIYKDLLKYTSIYEAFQGLNNIILLFPVQSDTQGHWVCIQKNDKKKTINHFDSYGLSWTEELGYTDNKIAKQNILGQLYQQAQSTGWNVTYNKYRLQKMTDGINTCGRWACMRSRMDYLNNDEFVKLFTNQKFTPDWYITCLTFVALDQDENDEEQVIRSLGFKQV